ncbi:MAG: cell division/cell wall cluster transcriptional repressor MraZ [Propionibacteriaceae bacterium]|jgi:MraZ protein|nr:cell division/cell wall cluster transcriptional repressor MraZ [Propionibacteriaceae bacterium]
MPDGSGSYTLLGTAYPKLDAKGRFFLPAKMRSELEEGGMVLSRGPEACLIIEPAQVFWKRVNRQREVAAEAAGATVSRKDRYQEERSQRMWERGSMSESSAEGWDDQGRVLVPAGLRKYAGLERELFVQGYGDRIEVWDLTAWNELLARLDAEAKAQQEGDLMA